MSRLWSLNSTFHQKELFGEIPGLGQESFILENKEVIGLRSSSCEKEPVASLRRFPLARDETTWALS